MKETFKAKFLLLAAAVFLCLSAVSGFTPTPKPKNPFDSFVGTLCQPPFGFRPRSCGDYEVLSEVVTPAPDFVYGPNTCRFLRMVRVNELNYEYSKYCDWAYSQTYYVWIRQCQLLCQPTRECSNRNQTIEVSSVTCCLGFETISPKKSQHYSYYYYQQFTPIETLPIGCPRAKGDTILECLRLHNLSKFIEFLEMSSYFNLLSRNDSEVTVLAPTNAAFDRVEDELMGVDPDMLVGNHIINQTLLQNRFLNRKRFKTLAEQTLHSTIVHFADYSLITYQPNNYDASNVVQYREVMFINGAQIENGDSCKTGSGVLHIIDWVLMPGERTIASILEGDPQFSMFVEALKFAGTFKFLAENGTSHTVFAPTNDAFSRDIPPDLFDCLTNYMRLPLSNLVLYHISKQTDHSSVLKLRQNAFSLFLEHGSPHGILVVTADNGTIFLGELGNQIAITMPDVEASNGVIHVIDGVLMPPNIDYGGCQRFVPTTIPPTTMPPTTMAPTTMAPTTMPPTTPPSTMATTLPAVTGTVGGRNLIDSFANP